jgi:hypothetical protein
MLCEKPPDERRIGAQAEEPVGLGHAFEGAPGMQRADAPVHIVLRLECLAADTVPPLVGAFVERVRSALEDPLDEAEHAGDVPRMRGMRELGIADTQRVPRDAEGGGDGVRLLGGCEAVHRGGLGDLLPVFVGADEESHVVADEAVETRNRVGTDLLQRVAQMRVAVCVLDGGRDVEPRDARSRKKRRSHGRAHERQVRGWRRSGPGCGRGSRTKA